MCASVCVAQVAAARLFPSPSASSLTFPTCGCDAERICAEESSGRRRAVSPRVRRRRRVICCRQRRGATAGAGAEVESGRTTIPSVLLVSFQLRGTCARSSGCSLSHFFSFSPRIFYPLLPPKCEGVHYVSDLTSPGETTGNIRLLLFYFFSWWMRTAQVWTWRR